MTNKQVRVRALKFWIDDLEREFIFYLVANGTETPRDLEIKAMLAGMVNEERIKTQLELDKLEERIQ